jgi:hypothetical protein
MIQGERKALATGELACQGHSLRMVAAGVGHNVLHRVRLPETGRRRAPVCVSEPLGLELKQQAPLPLLQDGVEGAADLEGAA